VDARRATLAVVLGLGALYALAAWCAPGQLVGLYHDDGIYVGTAIAVAQGDGFRIPHLPAAPLQAKYPPLFPLLLAPVALATGGPGAEGLSPGALAAFRLPVVVAMAVAVALLPGLFRRLGLGAGAAAWATAATGLSPLVFQHAAHVMSEGPFLCLSVAALRLLPGPSDRVGAGRWLGAAACVAAALLCRSVGLALLPAALVAAWPHRRDWRAWLPVATGVAALLGWTLVAGSWRAAEAARGLGPFYDYYLGYGAWIRPEAAALVTVASHNAADVVAGFGEMLCGVRVLGVPGWRMLALPLGLLVGAGWRWWPRDAAPAAAYLAASCLLVVAWPFPVDRFLVPLTPFALFGAWQAGRRAAERWHWSPRVLAGGGAAVLAACTVADLVRFPTPGRWPILDGAIPARDYADAAAWLRAHAAPDDVVVTDHDPWCWLATGRRAVPPGALDPLWLYREPEPARADWARRWAPEFERFDAEARRLGGRWLLAGPDWDPHFGVIWESGVRAGAGASPPRFARVYPPDGAPASRLLVFAIRP
jgi:hypothetical protein